VPFPGREVFARIWRIQVGRVPLYLLDTNIAQNNAEDRTITSRLYGGDVDMRVRQEMILGIGGFRALRALGKPPVVCHMNEGHSAFCGLERIRVMMEENKLDFTRPAKRSRRARASPRIRRCRPATTCSRRNWSNITSAACSRSSGSAARSFWAWAASNPRDQNEPFCMTVLAIRLSNTSNGVSKLHGTVSRNMWKEIWPQLPEAETPDHAITNGVHTRSWLAPEMAQLYERYLGVQWEEKPTDHSVWKRVEHIPNAELWRTHERRRERLVAFARTRLKAQLTRRGAPPSEVARAEEVLDPEALTLGFARRFATYKRGTLLFRNLERLAAILNNKERPVQIIFAGKAHPRDPRRQGIDRGDHAHFAATGVSPARRLHRGLRHQRGADDGAGRGRVGEQPAAAAGGVGHERHEGVRQRAASTCRCWTAGGSRPTPATTAGPSAPARSTRTSPTRTTSRVGPSTTCFEQEIVPLYYNRSTDDLPRGWLKVMKRAMMTVNPIFNTSRMVQEYMEKSYVPAAERHDKLTNANLKRAARRWAQWRKGVTQGWQQVRVENVEATGADPMHVGSQLQVRGAGQPRRPGPRRRASATVPPRRGSTTSATSRSRTRCR